MRRVRSIAYGCAVGLLACDTPQTPPKSTNSGDAPEMYTFLSPGDHLLRASMAIRGVRPTPDQLLAVEDEPMVVPYWFVGEVEEGGVANLKEVRASVVVPGAKPDKSCKFNVCQKGIDAICSFPILTNPMPVKANTVLTR